MKRTKSPVEMKRMDNKNEQACKGNEYLWADGNLRQWNDFGSEGQTRACHCGDFERANTGYEGKIYIFLYIYIYI